jgi:reductive dehalogenase
MSEEWLERPYMVDEDRYKRFSSADIAFNLVSREMGRPWVQEYLKNMIKNMEKGRISSLSGEGYEEVRAYVALYAGARTFNAVVGPYGEGRENLGLLSWNPVHVPEFLYRRREEYFSPEKLSGIVKRAAEFYGADKAGIAKLDRKWVYSETEREMNGGEPKRKRIVFEDVEEPYEDDEKLVIPEKVNRAVVLLFKHEYRFIKCSPDLPATAATNFGYAKMGFTAVSLAEFIRAMGYVAIPCMNDTALSVPLAIDAGLGEFGRHGLLITPEFGSNIRIAKVLTDMPLKPDRPVELGIKRFCQVCKVCAEKCPSSSIPFDGPSWEGKSRCNNPGVYKWYSDLEKCLRFWIANGASCTNCVAYCPFTKPEGFLHDLARWCIKHIPALNRLWVWMDKLLGYEKKERAERVWNR